MKAIPCCVLVGHLAAGVAYAQTFDDLQIRLGAYSVSNDGGEKPVGIWRSTGPVVIGELTPTTFSVGDTCGMAVSSDRSGLVDNATIAWHIDVTAIRVIRDAVTFRLRWFRVAGLRQQLDQLPTDGNKAPRVPNADTELTLRPGQSWQIDSVPVPSGARIFGRPCGSSASIRVLVDNYPWEDDERRLVAADLWLIERLSNGTEAQRSQALSVRSLPNRPVPFYFDSVTEANVPLDVFGTMIARLQSGGISVSLDTRGRWPRAPDSNIAGPQQYVKSETTVKPDEIVEIRLPKFDTSAGPFANREFSIRIRARPLR